MKLSKFELLLWKLFLEAEHPMSIEELKERLPCRYDPEPAVFLAVECLIHKKVVVEAGVHQSYIVREPSWKVECAKKKVPGGSHSQILRAYVSQLFQFFHRNKKSERRPHRNEVRISQFWWTIQDSNSANSIHWNFFCDKTYEIIQKPVIIRTCQFVWFC